MLALIMAGGLGTRMNMGEKPLVKVADSPMISYVIAAFDNAGYDVLVVVTRKVPMTKNWCRANSIDFYQSDGAGYVDDMVSCIKEIEETNPFFSCVSDIPGITPEIIHEVHAEYKKQDIQACSVWVPRDLFDENDCKCSYHETINGIISCPVGLNILNGAEIENEQKEFKILLNRPELTFNINTRDELKRAEIFFNKH